MLGSPAVHANEAPTIRYLGTAVNMGSEPEKKLFEDTGIKVKYISKTTDEVTKTILTQPNSFDIGLCSKPNPFSFPTGFFPESNIPLAIASSLDL